MAQTSLLLRVVVPSEYVRNFTAEKTYTKSKTFYKQVNTVFTMKAEWTLKYKGVEVGKLPTKKHVKAFIKEAYIQELLSE